MIKLNGASKWVTVVIGLLAIFAGIITAWAYNNAKTAQNEKDITEIKPRLKIVEDAVLGQSVDLKWIRRQMEKGNP